MDKIFKDFSFPLFLWQLICIVSFVAIIYLIVKFARKIK